jgi:prenylcysteine alpha-carboxyl methylesterase
MPSRMRHSKFLLPVVYDFIRGLFFHVSICYKLGLKLFRSLTEGTYLWVIMLGRLIIFTVVLLPGWIGMVKYWIFSPKIIRNVEYGLGARKRNLLDIYLPADSVSGSGDPVPVVVFVTGNNSERNLLSPLVDISPTNFI